MLSTKTKIALARAVQRPIMACRALYGCDPTTRVWRGGALWDLDLDEGIDFSIWLLGGFERRTLTLYRSVVKPGMVVADIGANIGAHTLPLAALVGDAGRVFAFEPTRWAFDKLQANLALNPELARRVISVQAILTDGQDSPVPTELPASWPLGNTASVHPVLRSRARPLAGAAAFSLDDYVSDQSISRIDFMKIDVDGNEAAVLAGAMTTVARFRPIMVVEAMGYGPTQGSPTLSHLKLLASAGYHLSVAGTGQPPLSPDEVIRRLPPTGGLNLLCLP